jgi:HD superfamily phosphohydrolase
VSAGFEIRDPIHGFIRREPHEKIVDCPTFQRLRGLKQLALANLVYPGATHTRFGHSLGTFHVAARMAQNLELSPRDTTLVTLAALLHDIGHAPFSHVSEPILRRHSGEKIKLQPKQQVHELISGQIIREDPELAGLILESDRQKIVALLNGEYGYTLFKDIVSGPLDADKQDYLLRDSYFCGVKYGLFDIDRLLNSLVVHDDGEDRFLAISKDGIHVLEQFVLAKYYMSTRVYHHRIRLITDEMIGRAISLGIEVDGIKWLKTLYSYDGSLDYVKEYLAWNDERLTVKILEESRDSYVRSIFELLIGRRLLKCIFDFAEKDFSNPLSKLLVFADSDGFHEGLQKLIADRWKFDPNLVICNRVTFKSPVRTESEISVLYPAKTRYFSEESTIFSTVNRAINEQRFQVYAPAEYKEERDKKRQVKEFEAEISEMISSIANAEGQSGTAGGNE